MHAITMNTFEAWSCPLRGRGTTPFGFPSLLNPTVVLHVTPCPETATNGGLRMLENNKQMTFSCEYKRTKVMWGDVHLTCGFLIR